MKWFKHDTDATQDAKIRRLLIRYGPTGYAVYFHSLELIAAEFSETDVSLRLEHDAEIIADTLHIKGDDAIETVEEILAFCVDQGLFVESDGVIRCPKMLARFDASMTSNQRFRDAISGAKVESTNTPTHDEIPDSHDAVMTESSNSHERRIRLRTEREKITPERRAQAREPLEKDVSNDGREVDPSKPFDLATAWHDELHARTGTRLKASAREHKLATAAMDKLCGDVSVALAAIGNYFDSWQRLWFARNGPRMSSSPAYSFATFAAHIDECIPHKSAELKLPEGGF
jgi:hypothetical protein